VALRNIGTEGLTGVSATFRSGDVRFTVTDSTADYGSIPADSSAMNSGDPFGIEVDGSVPLETPIPCTLFVSGSTDYEDTCALTIIIGELRSIDPIPDGPRTPALYWCYDDCDSGYAKRPDFEWVEVSGVGTELSLSDDQTVTVDLPSGFTWQFYGQTYTQLAVCGNGFIAPGTTTYSAYTNQSLPYASAPPMAAVRWDDMYPPNGGGVWYYHDEANHRFVVEWDSVHYFSSSEYETFEFVLYDSTVATPSGDNEFCYQYLTATNTGGNTVGTQDHTKTVAIECLFDGSYHRGSAPLDAGRAIRFTTFEPQTGVSEEPGGRQVAGRSWCSPNPFRAGTFVHYHATAPGPVEVAAFDATGREVDRFAFTAGQGRGSVRWQPEELARGMYFLKVSAPGEETVVKVLAID